MQVQVLYWQVEYSFQENPLSAGPQKSQTRVSDSQMIFQTILQPNCKMMAILDLNMLNKVMKMSLAEILGKEDLYSPQSVKRCKNSSGRCNLF